MEQRFNEAIALAEQADYPDIARRLDRTLREMRAETYRIAVVGKFKTGKSTLINRVFLKDDLLFTDLLEATAVPTEIRYGREPILEMVPYVRRPDEGSEGAVEEADAAISVEEGSPIRIANPSREAIRTHTAAATPEGRANLAALTARVRLYWPSENLTGLTLFDTPGINSVNEAVVATTYRIIPEADVVLFVTTARQLSSTEMDFLSGRVFSQGITRVMVVVTHDPAAGDLSADEGERLLTAIRAQLASLGHDNAPVAMVDLRTEWEKPYEWPVSIRQRIDAAPARRPSSSTAGDGRKSADAVIDHLLGPSPRKGPEPAAAPPPANEDGPAPDDIGIAALEKRLISFIRDNVRPGREEKSVRFLAAQLRLARMRAATELAAMDRSESERQQALDGLREREAAIREEHEALTARFREELNLVRRRFTLEIIQGIDRITEAFIAGFDACEEIGDVQSRIHRAEAELKREMEALFHRESEAVKTEIERLAGDYRAKGQVLFTPWQELIQKDLAIKGGVLANVPPSAIFALDFSIFVLFGPFRPLARILIRLLASEAPFLKRILPANVAAGILRQKVKSSLKSQFKTTKAELPQRIESAFRTVEETLMAQWKTAAEEELAAVREGVAAALEGPADTGRKDLLTGVQERIDDLSRRLTV